MVKFYEGGMTFQYAESVSFHKLFELNRNARRIKMEMEKS